MKRLVKRNAFSLNKSNNILPPTHFSCPLLLIIYLHITLLPLNRNSTSLKACNHLPPGILHKYIPFSRIRNLLYLSHRKDLPFFLSYSHYELDNSYIYNSSSSLQCPGPSKNHLLFALNHKSPSNVK